MTCTATGLTSRPMAGPTRSSDEAKHARYNKHTTPPSFHETRAALACSPVDAAQIPSQDIHVGDLVYLEEDQEVPCDLVIISCSEASGNCYIQTANLDGESNLKVRTAVAETRTNTTEEQLGAFKGVICAPAPDSKLYIFDAQLRTEPGAAQVVSLSGDQMLLQATIVRNTDWAWGVAVYTGNETKFGNNKAVPAAKWTKSDKLINRFSVIIFLFQLLLVVIFGIIGNVWEVGTGRTLPYLHYDKVPPYQFLVIPLRFLLLNSTFIPISLKV